MPEYGVWRQEKRHKQSEAERDTELYLYLNSFQDQPFHGMQFVTLRRQKTEEDLKHWRGAWRLVCVSMLVRMLVNNNFIPLYVAW